MDRMWFPQAIGLLLVALAWVLGRLPLVFFAMGFRDRAVKQSVRELMKWTIGGFGVVLLVFPASAGFADLGQAFNFFESWLWFAVGVVVGRSKTRLPVSGSTRCLAVISFLVFGVSDIIEMHTGAWYQPWSLFFLKAACVTGLLISLAWFVADQRRVRIERPKKPVLGRGCGL